MSKKVVAYYASWTHYRHGEGNFEVSDIDPNLCTHLIYAFIKLSGNNLAPFDSWLDLPPPNGLGNFQKFTSLKHKNSKLRVMAAVGGWNAGSQPFSEMTKTAHNRSEFTANAIKFLKQYNFDGLDIDWEYPCQRGGAPDDKNNFILLLKELYSAFKKAGLDLSVAVGAARSSAEKSYIIRDMHSNVDFINLMTYDLHGSWEHTTGLNAPLYSGSHDKTEFNVDECIKFWLSQGAPAAKLIMGIPFYGRSFTLANAGQHDIGASANGPGQAGPLTKQGGMLGYNEILDNNWTRVFDSQQKEPYAYHGNQWVGYDDVESIKLKSDYTAKHGLGGMMVWSLDTDDFKGKHGAKYPLLRAVHTGCKSKFQAKYWIFPLIIFLMVIANIYLFSDFIKKCYD